MHIYHVNFVSVGINAAIIIGLMDKLFGTNWSPNVLDGSTRTQATKQLKSAYQDMDDQVRQFLKSHPPAEAHSS